MKKIYFVLICLLVVILSCGGAIQGQDIEWWRLTDDQFARLFEIQGESTTDFYFYDIQYYQGYLPNNMGRIAGGQARSPFREGSNDWYNCEISSALGEIRQDPSGNLTNPHPGTDFVVANRSVYAILPGRIKEDPDLNWGMVEIEHDALNGTGKYYSRYVHMRDIPSTLKKGTPVTVNTFLGYASDVGAPGAAHLHLGIYFEESIDDVLFKRFMPLKWFINCHREWTAGRALDFTQPPIRSYSPVAGTFIRITACGGTQTAPLDDVNCEIFWRIKGEEIFTGPHEMLKYYQLNKYQYHYYYFDPSLDRKTVEYYIKITRTDRDGAVYRPMYSCRWGPIGPFPNNDPPFPPDEEYEDFYEALVTKGDIPLRTGDEQEIDPDVLQ